MQSSPFAQQPGKGSMAGFPVEPKTSGKAVTSLVLGFASLLCSCVTAIPALIFGLIGISEISRSGGSLKGKGLAFAGIGLGVFFSLLNIGVAVYFFVTVMGAGINAARGAAQAAHTQNNLKLQGLAIHQFGDRERTFPRIGNDKETLDGLSWRVHVLPYLNEAGLHGSFDTESGWESPSNLSLASMRPDVYETPLVTVAPDSTVFLSPVSSIPSQTVQVGIEGADTWFPQVTDGTSNTVMIAVCDPSTVQGPWTKGYDLPVNAAAPRQGLFDFQGTYLLCFADGSVRRVSIGIDDQTLLHAMQRNDGNVVFIP
ncbi:MAG TPA: DUF1559 domain-containing protein [Pirellulaceae bacterium]|nr:DUF1559 domain-containing protein [Pirellulaceae bacterium]